MAGNSSGVRMDVARAALLMDLIQAGVTAELADTPYDWWGNAPIQGVMTSAAPAQPAAAPLRAEEAPVAVNVAVGIAPRAEASPDAVAAFAAAAQALAQDMARKAAQGLAQDAVVKVAPREKAASVVWSAGEPGGVVLAVRGMPSQAGGLPYGGKMLQLLQAMLQAVGLQQEPVGWAVLGCEDEAIQPEQQDAMQRAILELQPKHVLVLGQVVVGTLAKQTLGVEGWQVAPKPLLPEGAEFGGRIGVTYPPELLLARPVFKRLAWQHLQKWRFA